MVEIENLSLSYGNNKKVLKNISLNIKKGECILLTGKSGSGKSSIINSINGLAVRYDGASIDGSIRIGNKDIKNLKLYEISMLVSSVFQNPKTHFFNVNTTLELLFYLENIGLSRYEMDKRLTEMLNLFPIEHLLNRDIFKLSGGEKQILCIAASYISGTEIIVLDEPSSNLDEENIKVIKEMLVQLKDKGKTLIISEHRIFYLMDIIDKIFLIKDGEIQSEYTKIDFMKFSTKKLNELGLRDKIKTKLTVPEIKNSGNFNVKNIEFKFNGVDNKLLLKNISFEMGKIYGIVGTNGLGKSTLLRCLIGCERKSKDEIYLDDKRLSKTDRIKISSLVMQDVNHQLFTDSVMSEVSLGIKNVEISYVEDILKKLDLYELKDCHPMSLSGGQKQRVAIASVLYKNSKLLFFDEPTSGMDYYNMMNISHLINECKSNEKIIFIVSHDQEFLNLIADYVVYL
ncbi:ABC transporter ATP-binding protein [Parvimonas micra]|uniref:ABC transporter ATP-binding protein n=1 Tax=Parvimonas micra TaxID=33033 RepID=UPI00200390C1|nr:ABC transporter ATP-binding protein [Parvimonas micra]MCK6131014.1 ABC transporter ATP-binding protein [Parvimonas micra]MCK6136637.1 ABC transporter ATP-binding protein [Parvimonas micra]MCK6138133.1 ABC transporter ATP-binding protein [Parvimonas micra]MCK6154661.1 ABC transporter ATP-binding protein [Parvimonas micra]